MTEKKIPGVLLVAIGLLVLVNSYQFQGFIDMTTIIIIGIIIIAAGIVVIVLDEYQFLLRSPVLRSVRPDRFLINGIREEKSIRFAMAGVGIFTFMFLSLGAATRLSTGFLLFTFLFCGISLAGFALFYIAGYYSLFRPR